MVIIISLVCLFLSCQESTIDLDCSLSLTKKGIRFENKDDFAYENVEITINDKYLHKKDVFYPSLPIIIPLREFSDDDGNRFANKVVKKVSVFCNLTEQGKNGYFYGEL